VFSAVETSLFGNKAAIEGEDESDFNDSFLCLAQEQFCFFIYDCKTGVMNYSFIDSGTEDGAAGNVKGATLLHNDADNSGPVDPHDDGSEGQCSVWLLPPDEGDDREVDHLKFHVVVTSSAAEDSGAKDEMFIVDANALALAAGSDMPWRTFLRDNVLNDDRIGDERLESILASGASNPNQVEYTQERVAKLRKDRRDVMAKWWTERGHAAPESWWRLKHCLRLFSARAQVDVEMAPGATPTPSSGVDASGVEAEPQVWLTSVNIGPHASNFAPLLSSFSLCRTGSIYIYICVCVCVCIYVCIYIYISVAILTAEFLYHTISLVPT
jgi:hypothetical protein